MGISMWLVAVVAVAEARPLDAALQTLPLQDQVEWRGEARTWAGGTWVVLTARVHDLPVLDTRAVVDVGPRDRVRSSRAPALIPPVLAVPKLTPEDAMERAEAAVGWLGRGSLWPSRAELAWQPVGESLRLIYAVDASTADPPGVWRIAVDAQDGRVHRSRKLSATAEADVFRRSPLDGAREPVSLANLRSETLLSGQYVITASCVSAELGEDLFAGSDCAESTPLAIADEAGDFFFADAPDAFDDPQAEVQVYHHIDRVASWLDASYGFRHAAPIRGYVNFEMANAFFGDFDGDGVGDVSFGQSENGVDFGYDADVVYHEFGHSVVGELADIPSLGADQFGLEWAGGSLNEGAADVLSMLLTRSPSVGPYAGSAFDRTAIRELAEPRRCPDDLRGEVHRDGEVLGAFAWDVMTDPRIPDGVMGDLLMGALPQWGADISWARAGRSFRVAANDLLDVGVLDAGAHAAVVDHLERSGLAGCGRAIPLEIGVDYDMYMMSSGLGGDLARIPLGTQFELTVPEDASSIWVDVTADEDAGWSLFGRVGEPIEHEPLVVDFIGIGTAIPTEYDWTIDGFGAGGVRLQPGGELDLEPGSTVYLSVASWSGDVLDLGALFELQRVTVSTRISTAQPGVEVIPGACATGGRSVGWLALAALVGLVRRRER